MFKGNNSGKIFQKRVQLMFWYLQANGIESNRIEWVRGKCRIKRSLTLAYYKFWPIHTHTHTFPVKYTRVKTFLGQHIFELGILGSVWLHFFCTPPPPFTFALFHLVSFLRTPTLLRTHSNTAILQYPFCSSHNQMAG